jgi:regulator of protease activity HflC (stomatin/prohibitin superfamily)
MKNPFLIVGAVVVSLVGFASIMDSWYTIDSGERGVILRNGAVVGTAEPGLNFRVPFIDSVKRISTQTRTRVYEGLEAYSRDQQPTILSVSVTYQIPASDVEKVYVQFGGEEGLISRVIDRQVNEAVRTIFGRFNAVEAVQRRGDVATEIRASVLNTINAPVNVIGFQMESIDFSDTYEKSIEQRMLAEVEVERVRQNAGREEIQAKIKVIQANAEAESRLAQARAEAAAIQLQGEAEAISISARGKALDENPNLISLIQAERWDGKLPTTMIPGSALPFINVR